MSVSKHHEWEPGEQAEYDSLKARGRTLYDDLRTRMGWEHQAAYEYAKQEYGVKET